MLKGKNDILYLERLMKVQECARHIVLNNSTIRETAREFGVSKSWLHTNIQKVIPNENLILYCEVREVLDKNKRERHIRGGMATKKNSLKRKNNIK